MNIEISEFKFHQIYYSFIGKMDVEKIINDLLPFIVKFNQEQVNFSYDGKEYAAYPGGIVYDKNGNFELNFLTEKYESDGTPSSVMTNSTEFQNLLRVTKLQDKVIRVLIDANPSLAKNQDIQNYLTELPVSLDLQGEVSDLDKFRKSNLGDDFLKDIEMY